MNYKDDIGLYAEEVRRILDDINKADLENTAMRIAKVVDKLYYNSYKTKTSMNVSYGEAYLDYVKTVLEITRNTPSYDPYFYLVRGIKGIGEIAKKLYDDEALDMLYKKLTQ